MKAEPSEFLAERLKIVHFLKIRYEFDRKVKPVAFVPEYRGEVQLQVAEIYAPGQKQNKHIGPVIGRQRFWPRELLNIADNHHAFFGR